MPRLYKALGLRPRPRSCRGALASPPAAGTPFPGGQPLRASGPRALFPTPFRNFPRLGLHAGGKPRRAHRRLRLCGRGGLLPREKRTANPAAAPRGTQKVSKTRAALFGAHQLAFGTVRAWLRRRGGAKGPELSPRNPNRRASPQTPAWLLGAGSKNGISALRKTPGFPTFPGAEAARGAGASRSGTPSRFGRGTGEPPPSAIFGAQPRGSLQPGCPVRRNGLVNIFLPLLKMRREKKEEEEERKRWKGPTPPGEPHPWDSEPRAAPAAPLRSAPGNRYP